MPLQYPVAIGIVNYRLNSWPVVIVDQDVPGIEKRDDIDELSHGHRLDMRHRHRGFEWYGDLPKQLFAISLRDPMIRIDHRCDEIGIGLDEAGLATELEQWIRRTGELRQTDAGDTVALVASVIDKGLPTRLDTALLDRKSESRIVGAPGCQYRQHSDTCQSVYFQRMSPNPWIWPAFCRKP